jgi:uncharacterized protein (TIGR02145 family)
MSFTTKGLPELTTTMVSSISATNAASGGVITEDWGFPVTEKGVCWSPSQNPTINDDRSIDGAGSDVFTSLISGFSPEIFYYLRAYATNSLGTSYGNQVSFIYDPYNPLIDSRDGQEYQRVRIGNQVWMAENLRATTYNDGTAIPLVNSDTVWAHLTTPAYCWYTNDSSTFARPYGALYNWYTVNTGKLCPIGWHMPTKDELVTLIDYAGGSLIAGGKLKEAGTTHWRDPNTDATNESRFSALPGGGRGSCSEWWGAIMPNAPFHTIGKLGHWWSSTSSAPNTSRASSLNIQYNLAEVYIFYSCKIEGYSVRCVKD